jgi:hypothetical protein
MLISCKKDELLLRPFAKAQSIYKYFSRNPVSALISSHELTISFKSKSLKLCLFEIVFNSSISREFINCCVSFK